METTNTAFIAVGSNIEPDENIARCLDLLNQIPSSQTVRTSSRYRTSPWGLESQPDFINLVVALDTSLSAHELLRQTQAIETELLRRRAEKNGPRTIDLDILLLADLILDEPQLQIPHPGLALRDFMLVPLIEIAADVVHPSHNCALRELEPCILYRQILERLPPPAPA